MSELATQSTDEFPASSQDPESSLDRVELDRRRDAGADVALIWNKLDDSLVVIAYVPASRQRYEIPVTAKDPSQRGEKALALFHHPFGRVAHVQNLSEDDIFEKHTVLDKKAA